MWENQQCAYAKTKTQISFAVTAKLISAFVFATRIVQFLFYLNPKFQASSSFLCLYRPVSVRPVRKPHCWFSHETAHIYMYMSLFMRKPAFNICKKHDTEMLSSNCIADLCLLASKVVLSLFCLNSKFQAYSIVLGLYDKVCVSPIWKAKRQVFSPHGPVQVSI